MCMVWLPCWPSSLVIVWPCLPCIIAACSLFWCCVGRNKRLLLLLSFNNQLLAVQGREERFIPELEAAIPSQSNSRSWLTQVSSFDNSWGRFESFLKAVRTGSVPSIYSSPPSSISRGLVVFLKYFPTTLDNGKEEDNPSKGERQSQKNFC